jgi:hypothetical protein
VVLKNESLKYLAPTPCFDCCFLGKKDDSLEEHRRAPKTAEKNFAHLKVSEQLL